ncbi:hypothetical protein HDC90_001104 [Pedobacter sp. AK013]|uniref:hypothetical protein n=1 Tax=Pedobacter sp. AK013 TaxID=2723071 RepID=UPI00160C0397|nr:hypothetical protein [Pedobacter sp. AK013]MBB6236492.1 hypothetical protein [Pedobacter sp. AK013]
MSFIAGDFTEVTCTHPTLGDFRFSPKSGESFNIDRGGIRSADDNAVTSKGESIDVKNNKGWSVDGPIATDLKTGYEEESIIALSADPVHGVWTFSHISGAIYKGTGRPVGDIATDTNTAQMTLKVAGGGKLENIA